MTPTDGRICMLGLPGLYQNWLMGALDTNAKIWQTGDHNFETKSDRIRWIKKLDMGDYGSLTAHSVINLYVHPKNFVWYLYNFFEKTDGVGIKVKNMWTDLFTKAPNTVAFAGMLRHFVETYGVDASSSRDIVENSLIEYFYFVLTQDQYPFRQQAHRHLPWAINIEYGDFADQHRLAELLSVVPGFQSNHFQRQYHQLRARNHEYLDRKSRFVDLLNKDSWDSLSTAYIGALITANTGLVLDWFNPQVRQSTIDKYLHNIVQWHNA